MSRKHHPECPKCKATRFKDTGGTHRDDIHVPIYECLECGNHFFVRYYQFYFDASKLFEMEYAQNIITDWDTFTGASATFTNSAAK